MDTYFLEIAPHRRSPFESVNTLMFETLPGLNSHECLLLAPHKSVLVLDRFDSPKLTRLLLFSVRGQKVQMLWDQLDFVETLGIGCCIEWNQLPLLRASLIYPL